MIDKNKTLEHFTKEFMYATGLDVSPIPKLDLDNIKYWGKLIDEETTELISEFLAAKDVSLDDTEAVRNTLANIGREACDVLWVTVSLLQSLGLPVGELVQETARSKFTYSKVDTEHILSQYFCQCLGGPVEC